MEQLYINTQYNKFLLRLLAGFIFYTSKLYMMCVFRAVRCFGDNLEFLIEI